MPSTISPRRPTAAYKLLVYMLYNDTPVEAGKAPLMQWILGETRKGYLEIPSIRRLARLLGTESRRVNAWLIWLYQQGLIDYVAWSEDRRSVKVYLRKPRNI